MSFVSISANKNFNQQETEVLHAFRDFVDALIRKDQSSIDSFLAPSFQLIHMTGKVSPKKEFIGEIMGGILNYYNARLVYPQIQIKDNFAFMTVDIEFDAKVYGAKGNWTLRSKNTFQKINNRWLFIKWDN
ncbi:hypothetical protein H8356DRAFT_1695744 [Neocallimastix lanati (nom. inval.)]|jgi:ketosteroid isomerase-like protein|uniref:DUF4440 domain-containing protein n=1 Tax=Neocallimastix californiae TaxID=1754190 RepID=A0A1Y2EJ74_9FUNG|nr:hypothetical protein H8356DRAFT_1695744 [Neocallimastix sp. JGI-2020a]ORY70855.1 hypothetical protein LY90DRAFT_503965 [Neocallimastix californiae]|eukprot:ORY70855.1 hypothetical protein LY90DRAFT_503965 [Neocallimastix californiae]